MNTVIKELLISMGGGAVVLIALLLFLKIIIQKIADKAIESSFEKNVIRFTNKVDRATKAYEILVEKEFEFYEKMDEPLATLVPLIQDMNSYAIEPNIYDYIEVEEKYRESLLKYLEMIPSIKNEILLHQVYIPDKVFKATSKLVGVLQSHVTFLCEVFDYFENEKIDEIDLEKMKSVTDEILLSVAAVETVIKIRLENLSNIDIDT